MGEPRGFTLVELAVALAAALVLATIAVPSYRGHLLRARRIDAVQALTRLETKQEQRRAASGLYASDLGGLAGVGATSAQGFYLITLESTGPNSYHAAALAIGAQADDKRCATITLDVASGFAHAGPTPTCWNR
jgi:type IV pilus assembly protein PilE